MVDTNCPWTPEQARHMTLKLRPYGLHWLEEPIFPPEDFAAIAKLRAGTGVPMAAGENNCTSFQFRDMFAAGAVDYAQPSVTKVGGVTEFLKVASLADAAGVTLMPHSPYFGPGFLATLQLMAARGAPDGMIERYHLDLEASLYGELVTPVKGGFVVPTGPGLGRDPDPDVIKTYGNSSS
jgi:L-alanine-DL-glutamate epimerase-like enolase superfamily enzyme